MEFLRLFFRRHFAGKPLVGSLNVGFFFSGYKSQCKLSTPRARVSRLRLKNIGLWLLACRMISYAWSMVGFLVIDIRGGRIFGVSLLGIAQLLQSSEGF